MADKPVLKYRLVQRTNPRTGQPIAVPMVTGRQTIGLKQLVAAAKAGGYVRGQLQDLEGLLKGFLECVQAQAKAGVSVNLDGWLIVSGTLRGQVGPNGELTAANSYHVTVTPTKDLRVPIENFTFERVDGPEVKVVINTLTAEGASRDGVLVPGTAFAATGKHLRLVAGDSIVASWGESSTATLTASSSDFDSISFEWPEVFDQLTPGTGVVFTFSLHGGDASWPIQVVTKKATING